MLALDMSDSELVTLDVFGVLGGAVLTALGIAYLTDFRRIATYRRENQIIRMQSKEGLGRFFVERIAQLPLWSWRIEGALFLVFGVLLLGFSIATLARAG